MEVSEIKLRIGREVIYNDKNYILSGCILRKGQDGKLFYQAEIKDVKANSVIICRLSDIK